MQNLLYLFLFGPLLLSGYYWYTEEYRYTGKKLSLKQLILLCAFIGYAFYCSSHGVTAMLDIYSDYRYKTGRALSVTGMWTFVLPGVISALIIFPRETLLYVLKKSKAAQLSIFLTEFTAVMLILLTCLRHSLVV